MTDKPLSRMKRGGGERLEARLRVFAERHEVILGAEAARRLAELDRLLSKWGDVVDLSGFRDADERVNRYFLEPLHAARWVPAGRGEALDVGSGGGSPALPLAVASPGKRWTLLEPNRRRAVFLEEALSLLGLEASRVERARLETYEPGGRFLVISSRGVSLDASSVARLGSWLEPGGRLLLFTGSSRSEALVASRGSLAAKARVGLAPEFSAWLVVLEKTSETTVERRETPGGLGRVGGNGT